MTFFLFLKIILNTESSNEHVKLNMVLLSEYRKVSPFMELNQFSFLMFCIVADTSKMMYNILMDKQWDIEFYSDNDGNCEIAEWIMKLKVSQRDKVIAWIDKLQEMGPLLPRPYVIFYRMGYMS